MLNTQNTSGLRDERQESGTEENGGNEKSVSGKTRTAYRNHWSKSHGCNKAIKKDCISSTSRNHVYTNDSSGTTSSLYEENQENSMEPAIPCKGNVRGYFNSKFNNRLPLSLHPPVSMETENSGLFNEAEEINCEDLRRIMRMLQKSRVERNSIGIENHLQRGNETIGEKTIKLAREKNILPEVISKRGQEIVPRHFLPKLDDKICSAPSLRFAFNSDETFSSSHESVVDSRALLASKRSMLAWSTCAFPAILVEYPVRKSKTSLERRQKRVKRNTNTKLDLLKPAGYTELDCSVQHPPSPERPISGMLYPPHHGP